MLSFLALVLLAPPTSSPPWSNGPVGNAATNLASECSSPPYAGRFRLRSDIARSCGDSSRTAMDPS